MTRRTKRAAIVSRNCFACTFLMTLACTDSAAPSVSDFGNCDPPASGVWSHIGLDSQHVTALAETHWGLFAGTSRDGVFGCSPETGRRWRSLGLDHARVSSLLFVPGATPRLLAGVRPLSDEKTDAAVFATEDRGRTWLPWDGGLAARNDNREWTWSLARHPIDPQRLYLGQSFPILRSADGGRTWLFVVGNASLFGNGINSIVFSPQHDGRMWAGGEGAIFNALVLISEDWGDTWKPVIPFLGFENAVFDLAVDESNPARLWAAIRGGVARSDDFGETWSVALAAERVIVFSLVMRDGQLFAVGARFRPPPEMFPTELVCVLKRRISEKQAPISALEIG